MSKLIIIIIIIIIIPIPIIIHQKSLVYNEIQNISTLVRRATRSSAARLSGPSGTDGNTLSVTQ